MPTVPTLEAPTVQEEPLPGRAFPRLDTNVPEAAFGSTLAAGIERASEAGVQQQAVEKRQNDQLRVIDANTQLEAAKTAILYGKDGKTGVFSLHGEQAMNLPDKVLPQFQQIASGISSSLTPDQQRMFQAHVAAHGQELNLSLNRYEYEEHQRLQGEVYANGIKQQVEGASVGWRDPVTVGAARLGIKGLIDHQGEVMGWPQSMRDEQTQKALAQLHYSVVDRMLADGQPQAALNYFVGTKEHPGIRDSSELTGEQAHQLGATIDAALRQKQADGQQKALGLVKDIAAFAMNGGTVDPGQLSTARAALHSGAFDADTAARLDRSLTADVAMGADLKRMAGSSPEQVRAIAEHYKPTSVEGAAEGFERYSIATQAANRDLAARAADPRQYAVDNLGSAPIDWKDMKGSIGELRSRLGGMRATADQVGGYVPPLTKQESARLAGALDSMPADAKLKTLATLNHGLGDDAGYQEVMRQVMPGSPVTAVVGSHVGRNDPNEIPLWFDGRFARDNRGQELILKGEALLNPQGAQKGETEKTGKPAIKLPPDEGSSGLYQQFLDRAGHSFRDRPELQAAYYAAFKAAYAGLSAEAGDFEPAVKGKRVDAAFTASVGQVAKVNGERVPVPDGMDPSKAADYIQHAAIDEARRQGGHNWSDISSGATPVEVGGVGSGRYKFKVGNAYLPNVSGRGDFTVDVHGQTSGDMQRLIEERAQSAPLPAGRPDFAIGSRLDGGHREPAAAGGVTAVEPGKAPVARPPPSEPHLVKTPALHGGGKGKAHPSQGEAPSAD